MNRCIWGRPVGITLLLMTAAAPLYAQTGIDSPPNQPVFLPMLAGNELVPTPVPTSQTGERVYSLPGTIEVSTGRRYSNYLVMHEGEVAGLAGETPDVEQRIDELAALEPPQLVKVWGVLNRTVETGEPWILVTGIISAGPAPTPEPASQPTALVRFGLVTLRAGPAQSFAATGSVVYGQICDVTGRDIRKMWWQMQCENDVSGWIDNRLVEVSGDTASVPVIIPTATVEPTPAPIPSATATPVPPAASGWRVSLYDNMSMAGSPKASTTVDAIDFDWGAGTPHGMLPADRFSILFERELEFAPGYYQFHAQADDGVRVWIDDQLVIDEWHGAGGARYTVNRALHGEHDLRVEYYEAAGLASIRFDIRQYEQAPEWQAQYYAGTEPSGNVALVQQEPRSSLPLDYDWSYGAPAAESSGIDLWSARWKGEFDFEEGDFMFRAIADDGVRVYLDGLRVIDQWRDGYTDSRNRFIGIGKGRHLVEVEYYERTGRALLRVWWYPLPAGTGPR